MFTGNQDLLEHCGILVVECRNMGKNFISSGHICTTYWSTQSKFVEKFRPIHGLSFTQQSNFDMLNNFLRNQLKQAASVPDFSSTSVKNGLFEKILLQNQSSINVFMNWWTIPYQLPMFRGVGQSQVAFTFSDTECLEKSSLVRN